MAIVLFSPELDEWKPGEHNGTFRGNNHAFVTAAKALEVYWSNDDLSNHIQQRALQVTRCIQMTLRREPTLFNRQKGRGLMQGIECCSGELASKITARCFELGLVIETAGPEDEVIKFFCPLTISEAELEQGLDIFEQAVEDIAAQLIKKAS